MKTQYKRQSGIPRAARHGWRNLLSRCLILAIALFTPTVVSAQLDLNAPQTVTLINGIQIQGRVGSIPQLGANLAGLSPNASDYGIYMVDDGLRFVFVSRHMVANLPVQLNINEEEFEIFQKVHKTGTKNSEIGTILNITPFDEHGRRDIVLAARGGSERIKQGITLVTPRYCRVEGVTVYDTNDSPFKNRPWDMRIATNSIPSDVLVKILHNQIKDPESPNERLRLVQFFAQAEMYRQAERELNIVRKMFPGLKKDLQEQSDQLRQQIAREVLNEARLRKAAHQPMIARQVLGQLNSFTGLSSELMVEFTEMENELAGEDQYVVGARQHVHGTIDRVLADPDLDGQMKAIIEKFKEEMNTKLRLSNVNRLATYERLSDDPTQTDQQKLALALSGWVIGSGSAIDNLAVSQSLMIARELVREYLQTKRPDRRKEIREELKQLEGGAPQYVAGIVRNLTPPLSPSPNEIPKDTPMEFEVEIPGDGGAMRTYLVQLPAEYDPYYRYPCIVTLEGETPNTTPHAQIEWWAGRYNPRWEMRMGQASRRGFIVVAPSYRNRDEDGKVSRSYTYSDREHAVVLKSLRDAMRRFAIDSDRVFLTGHFQGADAAWDIAQAHPEHWAGVIPISGINSKYVQHYKDNVRHYVPFYYVNGARDYNSLEKNAKVWNHHMISNKTGTRFPNYETIIVQYQGRGAEKFSDEIQYLFDWMIPQNRNFDVREFACSTLRPTDNYFWWFEVDLRGNPKMISSSAWHKSQKSDWRIEGKIPSENTFHLRGAKNNATLWLSPALVDFSKNITIEGSCGDFRGPVIPSSGVILEDARRRADRQHPYWGRIDRIKNRWIPFTEPGS